MSHSEMLQVIDPNTGEPTGEHVSRKELYEKKTLVSYYQYLCFE